ncbi:ribonuclease P protein subunit p21 [Pogonomyrmex barbatus]|uniref:Ribonuclease P protein subunit p21 n=1 Tax=Pogonomyrmex barbatus TaxID=144034 RepID=A0A8N1S5I3_9HYME|nr:ribonuclease P protein subunit p21 [Pogonomyrmex barbatus]
MKNKNKFCQHKDVFERMNYLYQASYLMATSNRVAASYFGNNMVACAKKAVLRMEPDLKRSICKWCQSPLIPGESARVRLLSNPLKGLRWTCLTCMNIRKFVMRKGYKLWLEQPESIIETLDFTAKSKIKTHRNVALQKYFPRRKNQMKLVLKILQIF